MGFLDKVQWTGKLRPILSHGDDELDSYSSDSGWGNQEHVITWETVRNMDSQSSPLSPETEAPETGAQVIPMYPQVQESLS